MMHVPTIVVYKMNPVTTWIGRRLIKVKWVSLVNILLNHEIYPEFLGGDAVPEKVLNTLQLLTIPSKRQKMIADLESADGLWQKNSGGAGKKIAIEIKKSLR